MKARIGLGPINFVRPGIVALSILIIAGVANQTVNGFNWGPGDFVGMGLFVYIFGLIFEIAMVKVPKHRIILGALILIIFFTLYGLMATTD